MIYLQLTLSRPDRDIPVTTEIVDTLADRSALSLTKRLLHDTILDDIERLDKTTEERVAAWNSVRTRNGRARQVIAKFLADQATQRAPMIRAFVKDYPYLIKEDKTLLRDLYEKSDYPLLKEVKKQFKFEWAFLRT